VLIVLYVRNAIVCLLGFINVVYSRAHRKPLCLLLDIFYSRFRMM
jgi:hypothetical protein